jgi:SAM-dependent methyltransferase
MEERSDLDEVIAQLRARVEERRRAGDYPPGMEDDLDRHFRRVAAHRALPDHLPLEERLRQLSGVSLDRGAINVDSELPGGTALHRLVAKAVGRQTEGVLDQVRQFADAVRSAFEAVLAALEDPYGHTHGDLVDQLDAVLERLAGFERGSDGGSAMVGDLRRRVERLEAGERARRVQPWYTNERFEAAFRGSREDLHEQYRDLATRLADSAPVLDIGCGRGEFLELLAELGVEASGVELDPALAQAGARRGLNVEVGEGLRHLGALADRSLGGISMIQVVEHLAPQGVLDVVPLAAEKLRPGGLLVMESVNCQSLYAMAHPFFIDPTHIRPVHPAYLAFLAHEAGFAEVSIEWRSPPPKEAVLLDVGGDGPEATNVRRLNEVIFGPQDYAVIASR